MSTCSEGLASVYSALRAGWVPHVCRRASSSPARLVQNEVWPISSFGTPFSSTSASTPASRRTSIVRWLVMCARGVFAVQRYFVMHTLSTPSVLRNSALAPPAGPLPTMRTSVSNTLMRSPPACGRVALRPCRDRRRSLRRSLRVLPGQHEVVVHLPPLAAADVPAVGRVRPGVVVLERL